MMWVRTHACLCPCVCSDSPAPSHCLWTRAQWSWWYRCSPRESTVKPCRLSCGLSPPPQLSWCSSCTLKPCSDLVYLLCKPVLVWFICSASLFQFCLFCSASLFQFCREFIYSVSLFQFRLSLLWRPVLVLFICSESLFQFCFVLSFIKAVKGKLGSVNGWNGIMYCSVLIWRILIWFVGS